LPALSAVAAPLNNRRSCVYVVFIGRKVHYVGMTKDMMRRIEDHLRRKLCNVKHEATIVCFDVPEHLLEPVEELVILSCNPALNRRKGGFPVPASMNPTMRRRYDEALSHIKTMMPIVPVFKEATP
jgi:hypothetical protein